MDSQDRTHSIDPSDAKPADDAPDYRDVQPSETTQDPVEDTDADREPGPTKS